MSSLTDLAGKLNDRIWFTRIARIYSEKRLLRNEFHSQLLLMLYSVYSIALSVILLKYHPISDDAGAVFGIILSVTLFGLSFYLTSRGFSARAQRFKENYTRLDELLGRLNLATCQADPVSLEAMIAQVQTDYGVAKSGSENHTTMDDRCARFLEGKGLTSRKLTHWDYACVLGYTVGRYLILGLLYVSPPVVFGAMLFCMK